MRPDNALAYSQDDGIAAQSLSCAVPVDRARATGTVAALQPPTESPAMFSTASLWIPFTIVAALGQVARNAMQRS